MAKVYWIHLYEHCEPDKEGYVGVSTEPKTRVEKHLWALQEGKHENIHLTHAYLRYGSKRILHSFLFEGDKDMCYEKERELRPTENIGWNIAAGGSKPPNLKGKKKSAAWIEKRREFYRNNPDAHWSKGPNAAEIASKIGDNSRGKKNSEETKHKKKIAANSPERLESSRTGGRLGAQRRWGGI